MKNKINYINTLLTAFEARNEQLHEEIKENEKAMEEMRKELTELTSSEELFEKIDDSKLKMVA